MAKLSAHGKEIGTIFYVSSAKKYFEDGVVMRNNGTGWKIAGKVKPEYTPQQAFERSSAKHAALLQQNPALAAYRKALHSMAGMGKRWKLHMAIEMMPDDPDGVWSECCDGYGDNINADVDDVAELCRLYRAAAANINKQGV